MGTKTTVKNAGQVLFEDSLAELTNIRARLSTVTPADWLETALQARAEYHLTSAMQAVTGLAEHRRQGVKAEGDRKA